MLNGLESLKLAKELKDHRKYIRDGFDGGIESLRRAKEIRRIRKVLTGIPDAYVFSGVDVSDKEAVTSALKEYFSKNSETIKVADAKNIESRLTGKASEIFGDSPAALFDKISHDSGLGMADSFQLFSEAKEKGTEFLEKSGFNKKFDELKDDIGEMEESLKQRRKDEAFYNLDKEDYPDYYKGHRKEHSKLFLEYESKNNALHDMKTGAIEADNEARIALHERISELISLIRKSTAKSNRLFSKMETEHANSIKKKAKELRSIGAPLLDVILDQSTVSKEDAQAWAESQEITPQAIARLKKVDYTKEQVTADMAEFYRFTNGKLRDIRIDNDGSRRAHATEISAGNSGGVYIDGSFDKKILFHEMAHHLEDDHRAMAASNGLIHSRKKDDKKYSLRSLTGSKGYRSNEAAYDCGFFSAYVGKYYRDNVTEVFAMGAQCLSSPEQVAMLAEKDPEHLAVIMGYLSEPMSDVSRLLLEHSRSGKKSEDKDANTHADLVSSLSVFGKKLKIDKSWFSSLHEEKKDEFDRISKRLHTKRGVKFLGKIDDLNLAVFQGSVISSVRGSGRRAKKGFLLIDSSKAEWTDFSQNLDWRSLGNTGFHGDDKDLFATLALLDYQLSESGIKEPMSANTLINQSSVSGISILKDAVAYFGKNKEKP